MRKLFFALLFAWLQLGATAQAQDTQASWKLDPNSIRASDYQNLAGLPDTVTFHFDQRLLLGRNHFMITPFVSYTDIQYGVESWKSVSPGARFSIGNFSVTASATASVFPERGALGLKEDGYRRSADFALPYEGLSLRASQIDRTALIGMVWKY